MTSFLNALRAEHIKSRRSFAAWLAGAGTGANLLMLWVLHLADTRWVHAHDNPWQGWITGHYQGIAFMMLPLFVIILTSLVAFQEHRRDMWMQLLALPTARSALFFSKFLWMYGLFVAAHLAFIVGMLLTGALTGLLLPATGLLGHWPAPGQVVLLASYTMLSVLGLAALHFWLSLVFRHFIIPLTIGILGFVLVQLLGPASSLARWLPYGPPVQFMPAYESGIVWQWQPVVCSLAYAVVFGVVGRWAFLRMTP